MSQQRERRVLVASGDLSLVDRFLPILRRANFSLRRALEASAAAELASREAFELVIVALPLSGAGDLLRAVRTEGSRSQQAALLLVADVASLPEEDRPLLDSVNRVLPSDSSPGEIQQTIATLLDVAPRADVRAWVRMVAGIDDDSEPRVYRVENLSAAGMFLAGGQPLPVGTELGFELLLPAQKHLIRGRARVVRHAPAATEGEMGFGAAFLALGGEAPELLRNLVSQERAAAGADPPRERSRAATADAYAPVAPGSGAIYVGDIRELAQLEEELADVTPHLEDLLRQGLARRLEVADWYVTGAELGLESLRAFTHILEEVHEGRAGASETAHSLRDLIQVRQRLTEFAKPGQSVPLRIEIMLEIRPTLERLLRELAESGRFGDEYARGAGHRGVISRLAADIARIFRSRRSLGNLRNTLADLLRTRYAFARRVRRRASERVHHEYGAYVRMLGLPEPKRLASRRGLRSAIRAIDAEIVRLGAKIQAIHDRVYGGRFRERASGEVETDLGEASVAPVMAEILAAGYEYLVRAYTAYRHALEVTGA
ncbi:MAG TPA: PilZ domain-containing protein, partial [Thermoanaerobaculia bacterium]|nr:PilZ domain-containing protein [Thermoanaerobaculia bacterium]